MNGEKPKERMILLSTSFMLAIEKEIKHVTLFLKG